MDATTAGGKRERGQEMIESLHCVDGSHVFVGLKVGASCLCGEESIAAEDIQELFCDLSLAPLLAADGVPLSWVN